MPDPSTTSEVLERVSRFLSMQDEFVRTAVLGAILLGINCGILGSFLVVRRMAMVGDTLSHAVLPGIVAGYVWNFTKDPMALLLGAIAAGLLGTLLLNAITATTKLKQDAAQGIVLTVFFAVGVCLISLLPQGNKAGINSFLFGQLAAVNSQDVILLVKSTAVTVLLTVGVYRGLLVLSFDPVFGRLSGLPMRSLHYALMLLTTLAIVVAMEVVGVILVSALLVIPAAAASLLTDRLHRLIPLAAGFGVIAAVAGSFISFVGDRLAAGPMVVICSAVIFALAFAFSPRQGVFSRWLKALRWSRRVAVENQLKAIYRSLENRGALVSAPFSTEEMGVTSRRQIRNLERGGFLAAVENKPGTWILTDAGQTAAARVVRHHRLWELYLAGRAQYPLDHVHDDAEKMEHLMSDEEAARLSELLGHPTADPHGKPIP